MEVSRVSTLLAQAMDYRAARQDMIASNIANADTPFYQPRDISFEDMLVKKRSDIFNDRSNELPMAQTNGSHLKAYEDRDSSKATTFYRDGHTAANDGNSVDIDVETSEMAKNSTMFDAIIAAKKKEGMMFKDMLASAAKN
jgi:flagellar basal-body rod protein FlgB